MHYDVFNGDADGILSLVQLRLAEPKNSQLITGVKRDISLVERVPASGKDKATSVTVLDISMEKNQQGLHSLIAAGCNIFYADHHRSGDIPESNLLSAHIDINADVCTALIIDKYLDGVYADWAIAAAFGDNLLAVAEAYAHKLGFDAEYTAQLKALGTYVNYNGYGSQLEDLHFAPGELFKQLLNSEHPKRLFADKGSVFYQLQQAYHEDMHKASEGEVLFNNDACKVIRLPDEAWARRVSGVLGNDLANQSPDKAHGVLTTNADGTLTVSVRAPLNNKQGADNICSQFATGGGRAGAAGINKLSASDIVKFIDILSTYYKKSFEE